MKLVRISVICNYNCNNLQPTCFHLLILWKFKDLKRPLRTSLFIFSFIFFLKKSVFKKNCIFFYFSSLTRISSWDSQKWWDCLLLLVMLKDHCQDTFSFIYGAIVTLSHSASHWCLWELTEHVPTHWLARSVKLPTLICDSVYGVAGAASQLWRGGAGAAWAGGRARGSVVPGGRPAGHIRECRGAAGWSSERSWTG